MKRITSLNNIEARDYFLKEESYFDFDLPSYFVFQELINKISKKIENGNLSDFYNSETILKNGIEKTKPTFPSNYENVNYKFLNNKDGKYSWRPFQLMHPAIYVSLVHKITTEENWAFIVSRFSDFASNDKIICQSLPIKSESEISDKGETVTNWWQGIEQNSIALGLRYDYIIHTDIADCYGSIYTHSIPWALHTREVAKIERSNKSLIGNIIDKHIQDMSYGQTNSIPQGSILMNLIAEIVLGSIDEILTKKLLEQDIIDYQILRYRDDYRVFSNNPQTCEMIIKNLTEILIDYGLKLNAQKTIVSNDVVTSSIKPDKLFWLESKKGNRSLQEHLLLILSLSKKHPNSGSLTKALSKYYDRIKNLKSTKNNIEVLTSILIDITFKNPRTYPISSAILSKFLSILEENESKIELMNLIARKFETIPNTGHIQIWLQRVLIKIKRDYTFEEELAKKVNNPDLELWNSKWLNDEMQNLLKTENIIDESVIEKIDTVIESNEVQLFESKTIINIKNKAYA
ncbi:RNA-directed DNA polymerase [Tenacibaculum finnmarkense]|uniref:RNA-directed DNA polymerase n=1 Tax=Tenacibaculum finnmarkense TaxID=2781243 RepID=UPI000C65AC91|nr:RNA-directed DNA polymerase [Tenacibaculum finnmarkense]MCD8440901.1 RNA-directed DNA polymerase [Tenacibaculum finnmarkense genomovar ulcerans]MCG8721815.1 RNA-directed DNA polymerase [Tenacibaculum finnmarkense]SOS56038.1 Reverse transcriptase [Tenacibaculum finnmarkense]